MADELIKLTFVAIKNEAVFENLKNDPGLCIQSEYPEDLDASAWAHPFQIPGPRVGDA